MTTLVFTRDAQKPWTVCTQAISLSESLLLSRHIIGQLFMLAATIDESHHALQRQLADRWKVSWPCRSVGLRRNVNYHSFYDVSDRNLTIVNSQPASKFNCDREVVTSAHDRETTLSWYVEFLCGASSFSSSKAPVRWWLLTPVESRMHKSDAAGGQDPVFNLALARSLINAPTRLVLLFWRGSLVQFTEYWRVYNIHDSITM